MNENNTDEEVVIGQFRAHFCESGKCNGNLHWNVWFDGGKRVNQFTSALPAIILLIEFAHSGKLDKYKAMLLGQRLLRRLPIVEDIFMPAVEAEEAVMRACRYPELADIVEKIFAEFKAEEAELANRTFGPSSEKGGGGKPFLAAVNE